MKRKSILYLFYQKLLHRKGAICFPMLLVATTLFSQTGHENLPVLATATDSAAQDYVTIENIYLNGNRHTKAEVILRELDFRPGDTISMATLAQRIEGNEYKLMNTGLFITARINFKEWEGATNRVGLAITVQESWYIYPFPILELADRNFNVWWETYNHSLRRLNLGVRFFHNNFLGRKDVLKAVAQFGFTKKYELTYTLPYFNKRRSLGLTFNFLNTREKEIGYAAQGNVLLFNTDADHILLQRFRFGSGMLLRRGLDLYHQWTLTFHNNLIDDRVAQELNPDFFLGRTHQRYFALNYEFNFDKRDIRPYPMNGYSLKVTANKLGFRTFDDIDAFDVSLTYKQYFTLTDKLSLEFIQKGKAGLVRDKQPYYNSTALGYQIDYLRGYEFYVIDGLDYAYQKTAVRYELFKKEINWGELMYFPALKVMPLKVFLTFHNELGYVNNPFYKEGNPMSNDLLWGASIGLDVIVYYNKVFNLEVSRNHLNEYGFFLHWAFVF